MFKDLFISVFRPARIYKLKNNRARRVVPFYLFVTLIFCIPMMISITFMKKFPFNSFNINITNAYSEISKENDTDEFKKASANDTYTKDMKFDFPSGVYIRNDAFYCSETISYEKSVIR